MRIRTVRINTQCYFPPHAYLYTDNIFTAGLNTAERAALYVAVPQWCRPLDGEQNIPVTAGKELNSRESGQYFSASLLQFQRNGRERLTKEALFMSAFEPWTYQIQGRSHINLSSKSLLFDDATNLVSRYKYWILTDGRLRERTSCSDLPNLCPKSPTLV